MELSRDSALPDEELEAALLLVLDDLGVLPALDDHARAARFAVELSLRVHAGEESDGVVEQALRAIPRAEDRLLVIAELANAHVEAGRLEDAETIAGFGLELRPAVPTVAPRLWHLRAEAARLLGRWDRVDECLDRMEASIRPHSEYEDDPSEAPLLARNHEFRARLLLARAQALIDLGLLDQCREPAREAILEAERSGDPSALAAARLFAIDRALASGGGMEEAIELAREGRADERLAPWHHFFRYAEGRAEVEAARAAPLERDAASAAERAREAFAAALAVGMSSVAELGAELWLADLERFMGRAREACAHLARARRIAAEMHPAGGPPEERALLAVLAWRLAGEGGGAELETRRAELFAAYRGFLREWSSTPHREGGIGFLHLASRTQLVSEVIEAELSAPGGSRVEAAFERLLEAQGMGTLARERGLSSVTLARIRDELLGDGRGMLVLLPARDRGHLFVLDRETIEHHRIGRGRNALRDRARRVTAALRRPEGESDAATLRALHDDLVPETARERLSRWSGAITVGFDLLCDLPFGILGAETGRPYGERLALVTLPSAALGIDVARRASRDWAGGKDAVLVVAGDPPPELAFEPFRFERRERERLLAPFAPERVLLLEHGDASRDGVLARRDELRDARVLHFLTHATTVPTRESSAALVLSRAAGEGQRLLTSADVAALELHGVVVVSACGAGHGPVRSGDDRLAHLGGAFLDAGARCVVLTRFPVEYEATLALMERLHARLVAGDAPAEALRSAREARGNGATALRCATFEVLGAGFEPVFGR